MDRREQFPGAEAVLAERIQGALAEIRLLACDGAQGAGDQHEPITRPYITSTGGVGTAELTQTPALIATPTESPESSLPLFVFTDDAGRQFSYCWTEDGRVWYYDPDHPDSPEQDNPERLKELYGSLDWLRWDMQQHPEPATPSSLARIAEVWAPVDLTGTEQESAEASLGLAEEIGLLVSRIESLAYGPSGDRDPLEMLSFEFPQANGAAAFVRTFLLTQSITPAGIEYRPAITQQTGDAYSGYELHDEGVWYWPPDDAEAVCMDEEDGLRAMIEELEIFLFCLENHPDALIRRHQAKLT